MEIIINRLYKTLANKKETWRAQLSDIGLFMYLEIYKLC
jgi:hypothetical protein